jgi:hypothetical protein
MSMKLVDTVAMAQVEAIDVEGRLWTDVHGNTFHSVYVSVLAKGETSYRELGHETFTYGYDSAYEQTAMQIMRECITGFNPTESALWRAADETGLKVNSRKENVKRKKDM